MAENGELPKQEMLLKLLKMTTSSNDGEALVAIRKANGLLQTAGWDWDKLIAGKIKVVGDPFAGVSAPNFANVNKPAPRAAQPPRPTAQPFTPPPPQPRPQAQPRKPKIFSTKANIFPEPCYCCGIPVPAQQGFIFDPATFNTRAKTKWRVVCTTCNSAIYPNIGNSPAPKHNPSKPQYTPGLNDL
jgi:hypothetical protein